MLQIRKFKNYLLLTLLSFINCNATVEFLDSSFGTDTTGFVTTQIGTFSKINGMAFNNDGKIFAVGQANINGVQNLVAAKYNVDGSLDNSFGVSGIVTTLEGSSPYANAVTTDSSNNVVVAGSTLVSAKNNILLVRYTPTGSLDITFGVGGKVTLLIGTSAIANSIAIDANGKILVAGTAIISSKNNLFVARFNSNGSLDTSFGTGGVKTVTANVGYVANSLKIDASAKIVVGGYVTKSGGVSEFLLARFNVNGTADSTFGTAGIVTTVIPSNTVSGIKSILIDSSNRIVAAGFAGGASNSNFALARYNNNGTLDTTFGSGSNGTQVTTLGTVAQINSASLDANGKIVVGGVSDNLFAVARYNVNGSLDTTFGVSGVLITAVGDSAQLNALLIQASDGKIVVGGLKTIGSQSQFVLARYNKNNTDYVNITSLVNGSTINTKIPVVAGSSSAPSAQVQVVVNGVVLNQVSTDSLGNWNAGPTHVLPIGLNRIQVNLIVSSVAIVSQAINIIVTDNTGEESLYGYSTDQQTTINTVYSPIPFNNITQIGTWSYSDSNFTCNKTGKYLVEYSGQAGAIGTIGLGTISVNVAMMIAINDIEYLGSESNTNIDLISNYTRVLTRSFVKDLSAGDVVNLNFAVKIVGDNTGFNAGLINNINSIGVQPCYSLAIIRIG